MIILTAIEDSKKSAASDVQNIYQGWAKKEWNNAKGKLIERLGYRSYRAPLSTVSGSTNTSFPLLPLSANSASNGALLQAHVDLFRKAIDQDSTSHYDVVHAMSEIPIDIYQSANMSNEYGDISDINNYKNMLFLLSNMVGERGMASATTGIQPDIGCYSPLAFASVNNAYNKQEYSVSSTKRCQSNLTCGAKRYFEQLFMNYIQNLIDNCIQQGHIAQFPPSVPGQTSRRLLLMYLDFTCRSVGFAQGIYNYNNYKSNKTDSKYVPVSYCKAMRGEDPSLVESVPLWIFVYYCIRIGDLNMALNELEAQRSANSDPNVVTIYKVLSGLQQIETNPSANKSIFDAVCHCRDKYNELIDRLDVHRSSSSDDDFDRLDSYIVEPYALHMLRICSISDVSIASSNENNHNINITNTVEDYMWTNVWYMYMSHYAEPNAIAGDACTQVVDPSNSMSYGEDDFYSTIESYGGQAYFDPNYDSPYTYVNVLLCCQRFGEAVLHLWICGKTFAAMQLLMSCVYYGVLQPHTKLLYQVNRAAGGNTYQQALYDCTSISLFETWMKGFINNFPLEMVPYLVILQYTQGYMSYLSHCSGSIKEHMILATNKLSKQLWIDYLLKVVELDTKNRHANKNSNYVTQLVGDSVDDGNRDCRRSGRDGIVDKYVQYYPNLRTIDELLVQCASILLAQSKSDSLNYVVLQGDNEENGYHLYMLSGRYVEIVEELCRHMCKILSDSVQIGTSTAIASNAENQWNVKVNMLSKSVDSNSDNEFWLHKCHAFFRKYIEGGHGVILKELSASSENGLELAKTLEGLLIIASIYDNYDHRHYNEVLDITQQLNIFPINENEVIMKSTNYYGLNKYIKYIVSDLCLINCIAIKILYDQCLMEKRGKSLFVGIGGTNASQSNNDVMIQNLQQYCKFIYMFVENIKSRGLAKPDVVAHIHRIYHGMM